MTERVDDERLLSALQALCDSLLVDEEWLAFRRDCCLLGPDDWHLLSGMLQGLLEGIWQEVELPVPTIWVRVTLTPCHRWRVINIYCTELNAVIATALLGWENELKSPIH